jgi:hypothetical protein
MTFSEIKTTVIEKIKAFFTWAKKQVMFYIAILAALVWFAFWFSSMVAGTETFPVGYWQKIPFGLVTAAIGLGCAFFYLKTSFPTIYDIMKEDTDGGVNNFTDWQKCLVWMFYVVVFIVSYLIGVLAL